MKKLLAIILAAALLVFSLGSPALAASCDLDDSYPAGIAAKGAKVFNSKCIACHAGGKNSVKKEKTLEKDVLEKNGYDAMAIIKQVKCGKGGMPALGKKWKPKKLANVAAYVLEQAEAGWK